MPKTKKSVDIARKQFLKSCLQEDPEISNVDIKEKFKDTNMDTPTLDTIGKWRKKIEEDMEKDGALEDIPEWKELKDTVASYDKQIVETKKEIKKLKSETAKASYKRLIKDLTALKLDALKQIVEIRSQLLKKSRPHYHIKIGDFPEAGKKSKK